MSARPIFLFFASVAMVSASTMVIFMNCQKDGKMIVSTRCCACPPSHHGSWLCFHACQCDTAKAFLKSLPKYSPQQSSFCCKKGRNIAWKVLICSNPYLDFHFLSLPGLKLGCHFFWVVEWLMLKTCLKRQQRDAYAESSQVQIASKSQCQVIFA